MMRPEMSALRCTNRCTWRSGVPSDDAGAICREQARVASLPPWPLTSSPPLERAMKLAFMAHLPSGSGVSLSPRSGRKERSDWRTARRAVDWRGAAAPFASVLELRELGQEPAKMTYLAPPPKAVRSGSAEPVAGAYGTRKEVYAQTQTEAKQKLAELKRGAEQGCAFSSQRPTVGPFLSDWLDNVAKPKLRQRSFRSYRTIVGQYLVHNS